MLEQLWLTALSASVGIAIETDDRQLLKEQLYRARTLMNDVRLKTLQIVVPQAENELWITHGTDR